eukprot:5673226-Lingulodinium_polyedra.AAC.1
MLVPKGLAPRGPGEGRALRGRVLKHWPSAVGAVTAVSRARARSRFVRASVAVRPARGLRVRACRALWPG